MYRHTRRHLPAALRLQSATALHFEALCPGFSGRASETIGFRPVDITYDIYHLIMVDTDE
jgi:hypothetical protein